MGVTYVTLLNADGGYDLAATARVRISCTLVTFHDSLRTVTAKEFS